MSTYTYDTPIIYLPSANSPSTSPDSAALEANPILIFVLLVGALSTVAAALGSLGPLASVISVSNCKSASAGASNKACVLKYPSISEPLYEGASDTSLFKCNIDTASESFDKSPSATLNPPLA